MNDDFNTPSALSVIFNLIRKTNKIINDSLLNGLISAGDMKFLDKTFLLINKMSDIFGILKESPKLFIETNLKDTSGISLAKEEIEILIEKRNMLRQKKDIKRQMKLEMHCWKWGYYWKIPIVIPHLK